MTGQLEAFGLTWPFIQDLMSAKDKQAHPPGHPPSAEEELSKQAGPGAPSQRWQSPALNKGLLGAANN